MLERKEGYAFEDHQASQSVADSIGLDSNYSELNKYFVMYLSIS